MFWDATPYILLDVNRLLGGTFRFFRVQKYHISQAINQQALLATCFMVVSRLAYSSTLKIEATCYSETLVYFQRIYTALYTRRDETS
jgi:hypothetical protein